MTIRTEKIEVTKKQEVFLKKLADEKGISKEECLEFLILDLISPED